MINLSQLEWHPARPGSRYMIRYAILDPHTRVTEEAVNGLRYGVQRRYQRGWGVSRLFPTLHEALEHAERLMNPDPRERTRAAREARRLQPHEATGMYRITGSREALEWWASLSARERGGLIRRLWDEARCRLRLPIAGGGR